MDRLFSIVFEKLPNPTFIISQHRQIQFANAAAKTSFGSIMINKDLAMTLRHPDILNAVDQTLATGRVETGEFSIPGPLDQIFEYHCSTLTEPNEPGSEQFFILLSLHDITKAARSEEMRADFVANASHELRSPLSAILGFIETLQGPASDDAQARARFLGIMGREAKRMNRLIDDLLQLSRVEIDEHIRPRNQVDVIQCIRNVIELLEPSAASKHMQLKLSGADHPCLIKGDSDQLTQVFRNLVENAIHYGHEKSDVEVHIVHPGAHPSAAEGGFTVIVQDRGDGIAKQHIPRLTERFYRIDDARTRHGSDGPISTGLGLAIVKHIVNKHRGRLKIESELGVGSKFSVFLPSD